MLSPIELILWIQDCILLERGMGFETKAFHVAIVGATGAVGREVLSILAQRKFPLKSLRLFASAKSAGSSVFFSGGLVPVEPLESDQDFVGIDICFFMAGSTVSEQHALRAAGAGALVIDNSSLFRMESDVPLVVPEINSEALELAKEKRVVANPNCTTAQLVMALKPLHNAFGLRRVVVSSYQAVSGKGQLGINEFSQQVRDYVVNRPLTVEAFPHPIAFNCLPHIDLFQSDGYTGEEHKVMNETKKILGLPELGVVATCVRVPVVNCHSESVNIETTRAINPASARAVLEAMPGMVVVDDPKRNAYPLAMDSSGKDEVFVGRIRSDVSVPDSKGLAFWIVADNLRKGAALNAVQIAEAASIRGII